MSTTETGKLDGQVAIVTGGGGGIGGAVAKRLAAEGAAVVVDDIDESRAVTVADQIKGAGGRALGIGADVSDPAEVDRLFETALAEFGDLTILVNNAGLINQSRHFFEGDLEWWSLVLGTNLTSVYLCSDRAARIMARRRGGAIISSSSGGATRAHRGNVAYDAAKGGIEAATRALALDLAPYGIRVNAVAPGAIDVSPPGTLSDEERAQRGASIPLGRIGVPEDLTGAYAFLAGPDAAYVTGVVVSVDGGMVSQQRSAEIDIFGLDRYPAIEPEPGFERA
ncbi:MAG TPA: glucose 1-dehydrogenase [Solirubrobacterales bacterium]|nr:glucose 1-dehydrogenase [Solirubrobacterales bacterium]